MRRALGPVAMAPCAVEVLEVGGTVLRTIGVIPERDGHARKRTCAHQFTGHADDGVAVRIPHLHRHAQAKALQFAAVDRQRGRAECKAGDDVGTTADAAQANAWRDRVADPVIRVLGQRTAGAVDHLQRVEHIVACRLLSQLLRHREKFCAGAEMRELFITSQAPEDTGFTLWNRRAIVQHDRRTDSETADQPVPHHPAAGRVVEHAAVAAQVTMQHMFLQVLQQRAAMPVHHALGQAGGA